METGTIFDIKEFAVYDGPGVRQTIFFKGCPLRCQWCHNPEGLSPAPQLMVSRAACTHCGRCRTVCACPESPEQCTACGACTEVCPLDLRKIAGRRVTSEELSEIIRKDADYYRSLEGGVTFSGGEPLLQGEFLLELLARLADLHTAIETSGYAKESLFREAVKRLSFVMIDLKLTDPVLHRRYTGVDNRQILENVRWLCQGNTPFVVRIPVIPGVNDNDDHYRACAALLRGAKALERVEFLPYHKTAGAKYQMVGRRYQPDFPTEKPVFINRTVFEEASIKTGVL